MTDKLYVEFRVYFHPNTNQELLSEVAEIAQEKIYNLFEGESIDTDGAMPSPHEVTYELVREVKLKVSND